MQPLLSINNLSVDFISGGETTHALKNISLSVNRGEILALVGESGSGKSVTSLSILQLLPSPPANYSSGEIQFAETGDVDVAIVALALSQASDGLSVLVPAELHKPIKQGLAVIKETKNEKLAREFARFVSGPEGQAVLAKYGFEQAN